MIFLTVLKSIEYCLIEESSRDQCSSLRSLAMDQGRMKSLDDFPSLGQCFQFPSMFWYRWWQEQHLACECLMPLILKGFLFSLRKNWGEPGNSSLSKRQPLQWRRMVQTVPSPCIVFQLYACMMTVCCTGSSATWCQWSDGRTSHWGQCWTPSCRDSFRSSRDRLV